MLYFTEILGDLVRIEVGTKVQLGEISQICEPGMNLYDVLIGGGLIQGKYVMPAILSTHIEPFTINYSKPNTKVMKES
jgi:hypothetical protein